jgi:hypothetical protein
MFPTTNKLHCGAEYGIPAGSELIHSFRIRDYISTNYLGEYRIYRLDDIILYISTYYSHYGDPMGLGTFPKRLTSLDLLIEAYRTVIDPNILSTESIKELPRSLPDGFFRNGTLIQQMQSSVIKFNGQNIGKMSGFNQGLADTRGFKDGKAHFEAHAFWLDSERSGILSVWDFSLQQNQGEIIEEWATVWAHTFKF